MKIVAFGLSITSAWGNGHATTFRALFEALHRRGHDIIFYEKDLEWYASNRDLPSPPYCQVRLYKNWTDIARQARQELANADVGFVGSYFPDGTGAIEQLLDSNAAVKAFYDIDTPITISELHRRGETEYLRAEQISGFDIYFSFTGGPMLREIETRLGARFAIPLYCSFDPREYRRYKVNKRFACDLSYMGTYAADRQSKLEEFLLHPAAQLPGKQFIVAGPQYPKDIRWPKSVRRIVHLNPRWHARFYSSSRLTLNITRREMVVAGYSPSVRLFEAAACGAAMISDSWPGLETFFTPGLEILLPVDAHDVLRYLSLSDHELRRIGEAAQQRALADHTSEIRAQQFENAIGGRERKQAAVVPTVMAS
jgi:spore maturation protein CgeB